jgi:putative glutamine amidotransferase
VVVAADRIDRQGHAAHAVLHGYVRAASERAGVMALGLPAEAGAFDIDSLIYSIDGVLLTGSPSNVAPECYGAPRLPDEVLLDPARDAAVLPLVRRAVAAGVPLLGVCRGFQEINVAFGGTLDPAVHMRPGRLDHREGDHNRPVQQWYEDSHGIDVAPGGVLANLLGERHVRVNSLHHQGIDRLGQGLRVEATAPDGLVEAFSIISAPAFALAVQFHPEMRIDDCPLAQAIFTAFGAACRKRLLRRLRSAEPAPALA